MTFALASRLSSIQILIPSRLDWSLKSTIPSILFSFTRSAIFAMSLALLTMYGSSVTMIRLLPFAMASILVTARTTIFPLPVRYASLIPLVPRIVAPVGKSGPFTIFIMSSMVVSLFSIWSSMILTTAPMTSFKLCGGIFVAIPTAIPEVPFTRRFGNLAGSTTGSFSVSSKFGSKSTVFLLISAVSSMEILLSLASV